MIKPVKFLLLEDNESDAHIIANQLSKLPFDYEFKWVESKKEFLDALLNYSPNIILCDYQMPSYSGLAAFMDMKEIGKDIPFVLITGTLGPGFAEEITKMGMSDYILKDSLDKLPTLIKRQLAIL